MYIYTHCFFANMGTRICENVIQNRVKNGPKSLKIKLWASLGALWGPSWRQDGAKTTTRAKINEKSRIWESLGDAKMERKKRSIKNLTKNQQISWSDFETTCARSWAEVGPKNVAEMRGPMFICSTL